MRARGWAAALAAAVLCVGCQPVDDGSSGGSASGGAVGGAGAGMDTCVISFAAGTNHGVSAALGLVTGSVYVSCTQPTQLHIVVTLHYDSGNSMKELVSGEFDGVTTATTVATKPANCYEGRYRASYTGTARANGQVENQSQTGDAVALSVGDCHR